LWPPDLIEVKVGCCNLDAWDAVVSDPVLALTGGAITRVVLGHVACKLEPHSVMLVVLGVWILIVESGWAM
jgi:hypothetical protein